MPTEAPEYLICVDCETPCYVFEWNEGVVTEVLCTVCGNDDVDTFATEEEWEALSGGRGGKGGH